MENNTKNILSLYGITDEDYEDILTICPGLQIVDTERIIKNISLVEQFGFPKFDMDSLILTNPDFLLSDPEELAKTLLKLGTNIESKLKENPFLI
ncbi:MAG: hypothetical protein IKC11_05975 [Clostridia bacterium]|nr:hypothetical protein [Clostridia bacterium]